MTTPLVPRLLHDSLRVSAERVPDRDAVVDPDARLTHAELLERATRLAAGLQAGGLARGDRVAILLDNGVHAIVAVYAALLAGGAFVLLHPHTRPDKLRFLLRDCGAAAWIVGQRAAATASRMRTALPDLRQLLVAADAPDAEPAPPPSGAVSAAELTANAPALRDPGTIPLDLAALIYTSGSTGVPKGVML
jgi:acyl-CoA synthetase (AMP-forming)/AMP-acid ligase II